MTDGGIQGTSGAAAGPRDTVRLRLPALLWWAYAACLAIVAAVTATSYWMEAARFGRPMKLGFLAVNEATSVVVIFALTWPLLVWTMRLSVARFGWIPVLGGHAAGALLFSLVHVAAMNLLRLAIFAAIDVPYRIGPLWQSLLYELRKDVIVYGGLVLAIVLLQRALPRPSTQGVASEPGITAAAEPRIEIRDGARRIWVAPAEILWVEAAGNYVEIHTVDRDLLWRRTMASVEAELMGHGFRRIHRSRLVNLRHISSATNNDNGDFTVTLSNGGTIGGARRWREAFDKAVAR